MNPLLDPRLADCRRLFVREVMMQARIGVHAEEKLAPQKVVLNVDLFVPLALSTPKDDHIDEVVDYDFIRAQVRARIAAGHINLQETLVDDLAATLLAHPAVRAVRVMSEKTEVYEDVAAVGIEVFRFKEHA